MRSINKSAKIYPHASIVHYTARFQKSNSFELYKRSFDIIVATIGLLLLAPFAMGVGSLIIWSGSGSVMQGYPRIGRGGKTFHCLKFRTISGESADRPHHLSLDPRQVQQWGFIGALRNDPRISPLGAVLRQYGVDGLPQLINVLRGEMSIVGPRSVNAYELRMYGASAGAYLAVKPGLTGLWKVNGRSESSLKKRMALDWSYAHKRSFLMDLRIILNTIPVVSGTSGT